MQTSRSATIAGTSSSVDEFVLHWEEIVRFIQNRKWGSVLLSGPEADLSHVQIAALTALAERELRMSDLADRVGLSESSATRLVDRLAADGFVERRATAPDRRVVVAGLTPSGRRVLKRIRAGRRDFLVDILQTLEPEDRAEMVRLFGKVAAALREREPTREARA